ncbi:hypothetical protein [Arthrobacter sp. zg-Y1110]|uniref:hypothetical protein n=1 Tax=Arthrobacter sp. zg-Y1110 TaxID=2886932 RepID=UPI001D134FB6|nr:hypothetical protein [Arthrobacter sp. zg-Y1110]MCC3292375.1 hypothetical protein [Arthrobacter sp. zg-Y1110]UWX86722.1 hypothetical protein N2K99_17930 [Arthrobacter sp. zg-Y1110]
MSTEAPEQPQYPMSEKLAQAAEESQRIGEFLDWLESKGMQIAEFVRYPGYSEPRLEPVSRGFEHLLAEYFEIDLNEVDKERRQILASLRE